MSKKYYVPSPRGRGRSNLDQTTLSAQSDGWNHLRPSKAILMASGLKPGDQIDIAIDDNGRGRTLTIEKNQESSVTVKKYAFGNKVQISWADRNLEIGLKRGIGHTFEGATASKGSIVIKLPS